MIKRVLKILFNAYFHLVMVGTLCVVLYYVFGFVYYARVFEVLGPVQVMTADGTLEKGASITVKIPLCKYHNIKGVWYIQLVNGEKHTLDTVRTNVPTGCGDYFMDFGTIPPNIATGTYHMEVRAVHEINALMTAEESFNSPSFEIR
jgi:hypothetical protein